MNILSFITGIFKPVADLVDDLTLSGEEKEQLRLASLQLQFSTMQKLMEYESTVLKAQQDVITTEAKSESPLTRSWRPVTMLTFLCLIVWTWIFGPPPNMPEEMLGRLFDIVYLGLGGYVVGRSAEKIVPTVMEALRK